MARIGNGFFDKRGQYFKSPTEASVSDLAAILGRIGDGESLAPGIAQTLLEKREEIEAIFSEHDRMIEQSQSAGFPDDGSNVTPMNLNGRRET